MTTFEALCVKHQTGQNVIYYSTVLCRVITFPKLFLRAKDPNLTSQNRNLIQILPLIKPNFSKNHTNGHKMNFTRFWKNPDFEKYFRASGLGVIFPGQPRQFRDLAITPYLGFLLFLFQWFLSTRLTGTGQKTALSLHIL